MAKCEDETIVQVDDTPLGCVDLHGCQHGLHALKLNASSQPEIVAISFQSDNIDKSGLPLSIVRGLAWLKHYFNLGKFDWPQIEDCILPICPSIKLTEFRKDVYKALLSNVPFGSTISYSDLAAMAGSPKASRAVGSILKNNPVPLIIPCHRVIKNSGEIGNFAGCKNNPHKQWLLDFERNKLKKKVG